MDDLNAVLHLAEHRMIGPASLRLFHDLLPVVLEFLQQDLAVFVMDVYIIPDRNLGLRGPLRI